MKPIPTQLENPKGLHQRYIISKANGDTMNPNAEYFVLRVDLNGSDPKHIAACRKAVICYANEIKDHLPVLSKDLIERYSDILHPIEPQEAKQKEEEPNPTSWRDFTMTDVEPKCEECPSKQFYEANTAKIMDKEEPKQTAEGKIGKIIYSPMTCAVRTDNGICNHNKTRGKRCTIDKFPDFCPWDNAFNSQSQRPEISVTDEEIEKEFPTSREVILKREYSFDLYAVTRINNDKQIGAKWMRDKLKANG